MKIKIEIDEGLPEDEVLIRCRGLTEQISDVQKAVSEVINTSQKFVFYRGNTEYYLTLDEILFFETDSDGSMHIRETTFTRQNTNFTSLRNFFREVLCGYRNLQS